MNSNEHETPNFLYHYTSIENLALILKNKTIRFTPLNTVDDELEGMTEDFKSIGQWVFVSCWTDDPEESIPMWNIYSNNFRGVRIRLPVFPFQDELYIEDDQYRFFPNVYDSNENLMTFFLSYPKQKLIPVEYDDDKKINLFEIRDTNGGLVYDFKIEDLGRYKRKIWTFQSEWRYKIFLLDKNFVELSKHREHIKSEFDQGLFNIFSQTKGLLKFYDLPLSQPAMNNLEVLMGPYCCDSERTIIEALVEKYYESTKILQSSLRLR